MTMDASQVLALLETEERDSFGSYSSENIDLLEPTEVEDLEGETAEPESKV